jgi:hypothetical protein
MEKLKHTFFKEPASRVQVFRRGKKACLAGLVLALLQLYSIVRQT